MPIRYSLLLLMCVSTHVLAQDPPVAAVDKIVIKDEPLTIDPAALVPDYLARPVTLDFSDSSLMELSTTLEKELKIPVLFDQAALRAAGIPPGEPVNDRLTDTPSYLLLNRLSGLGLTWFARDNVLHITTIAAAKKESRTNPYPIGDLIDAGFDPVTLKSALQSIIYFEEGPPSKGGLQNRSTRSSDNTMQLLGDVLFVRHNDAAHRQLNGLLSALRNHGRRTFVADPPQHQTLREGLDRNQSVAFRNAPLLTAVEQLSEQTGLDIRLDTAALRAARVREREPVSLELSERQLRTVLKGLLSPLNLTWTIRDGVIWVTTEKQQLSEMVTAVYDVRDLCADDSETLALSSAIRGQTTGRWAGSDSAGDIQSPRPGTVIIRQTEQIHREVLTLLQAYRTALATSRKRDVKDPDDEVLTQFYRVQNALAKSVIPLLPELVDGWDSESEIKILDVGRGVLPEYEQIDDDGDLVQVNESVIAEFSVLVVRQKRRVQHELGDVLDRLQTGDSFYGGSGGIGGGGFGGGGFGGGAFALPPEEFDE